MTSCRRSSCSVLLPGTDCMTVSDRARIDIYPVTPGDIPRVGEPTVGVFPMNSDFIGGGASLSGNRQLRIVRGQQETPATHVELILNWYDKAVKIIKDEKRQSKGAVERYSEPKVFFSTIPRRSGSIEQWWGTAGKIGFEPSMTIDRR